MKTLSLSLTAFVGILSLTYCARCWAISSETSSFKTPQRPQTVSFVDIQRYMGTWFEIATIPQRFEKNCVGSKAQYSLGSDGKVTVINSCFEGSFSGKLKSVKGTARIVDQKTNSKLKVTFFWPFSGEYWIVDLAVDYSFAVVSNSKKSTLWILNRKALMDDDTYSAIVNRLQARGFDLTKLRKTVQPDR